MKFEPAINDLCDQIVERFKPERVILFGSQAHSRSTKDSDVDLLVVMPFEGSVHAQAVRMRKKLESSLPLDLLVRTPEQISERIEMGDFFIRRIIKEGEVLYEANHGRMDPNR
ncbi:nucleotidyltransferase domain-containing protein [soil metagenome]